MSLFITRKQRGKIFSITRSIHTHTLTHTDTHTHRAVSAERLLGAFTEAHTHTHIHTQSGFLSGPSRLRQWQPPYWKSEVYRDTGGGGGGGGRTHRDRPALRCQR